MSQIIRYVLIMILFALMPLNPCFSQLIPTPLDNVNLNQVGESFSLYGGSEELILGLGTLNSAIYSPDGEYIVTGGNLGAIFWDADTASIISMLNRPGGIVPIQFTPDGEHFLAEIDEHKLALINVNTGEDTQIFAGHINGIEAAVISPNDETLITASLDKTIKIWDINSGMVIRSISLSNHADSIRKVILTPDGRFAAFSEFFNRTVKVINIESGEVVHIFEVFAGGWEVWDIAFSPNSQYLVAGSQVGGAVIYDINTGESLFEFRGYAIFDFVPPILSVTISQDSNQIIFRDSNGVYVMDIGSGGVIGNISEFPIAFSPDGRTYLSRNSNSIRIKDSQTDMEINTISGFLGFINFVEITSDKQYVLIGSQVGSPSLWSVEEGREVRSYSEIRSDSPLALSPNGEMILSTYSEFILDDSGFPADVLYFIKIWDLNTGEEIQSIESIDSSAISLSFSPDNKLIITGMEFTNLVKIWDIATGELVHTLEGHSGSVYSVDFSSDGTLALTGSIDKTAKLWDMETGELISTINNNDKSIKATFLSPNNTKVFTHNFDGSASMWDINTETELFFINEELDVLSASFSPTGDMILTGHGDSTAKLFDSETGQMIGTFIGHTEAVEAVNFSPDGQFALTGSTDGTARIWDIDNAIQTEIREYELY